MHTLRVEAEFLRVADVCRELGLDRRTVYRLIARQDLKAVKLGSQWFIRRSDLATTMGAPS